MEIHVAKNGQPTGPYSESQVREMLQSGSLSLTDLAWHDGLAGWIPLQSVLAPASTPVESVITTTGQEQQIGDVVLAERGARLGAKILDFVILIVCAIPGIVVLTISGRNDAIAAIGVILLGLAILGLAAIQLYLISTRGQSIGKRIVGVRIVTVAGNQNPGFVKAGLLRTVVPGFIGGIPYLGFLFSITDACFIFRDDRRCIHDLMAETKVIKVLS
jgi:uncharacterized RDD family membrane protein YckC